jgi:hypothetical protein
MEANATREINIDLNETPAGDVLGIEMATIPTASVHGADDFGELPATEPGRNANGRRTEPLPLTDKEKLYGYWFVFKTCVSITILVVSLGEAQHLINTFYSSNAICDACYLSALANPNLLYEFNTCGNVYNNYTDTYFNGTVGPVHIKYEELDNLLWRKGVGNSNDVFIIVIGVLDWLVIMYFTLTAVKKVEWAIQYGNEDDLEKAKGYLIHNSLLCHMIVFSISNTRWFLLQGDQGCYTSTLTSTFTTWDTLLSLLYIVVFCASSCCFKDSVKAKWVHVASLIAYALYSLVASGHVLSTTGYGAYFAFVFVVFLAIFDIPLFFYHSKPVREYLGYEMVGAPEQL